MSSPAANNRFGPYLMLEKLGSGSIAAVYRACNQETQGEVALKILRAAVCEVPGIAERFSHQLREIASLRHAHIVPVSAYGTLKGRLYLEMRYLPRGNLAARFRQASEIGSQETIRLLRNVSSALDYARRLNLLHGDVKLENIFLDERGNALLSDFGLAQIVDDPRFITAGVRPFYTAPELTKPDLSPDFRADLYALAVIAYALLVGRFPFVGQDSLTVLAQQVSEAVPPPTRINPQLPAALNDVLVKALAKRMEDRYRSADTFVEAVARVFADQSPRTTLVNLWGSSTPAPVIPPAAEPKIEQPFTADDWVKAAQTPGNNREDALACLRRALALEPLHTQANRLLFQLEQGKASPIAPAVETVPLLPKQLVEPLKKVKRKSNQNRKWTFVAIGGFILLNVTSILVVLNILGSPVPGKIMGVLSGKGGTTQINGTPVKAIPNVVLTVPPSQSKPIKVDTPISDVLNEGFSHEYLFDGQVGQEIGIGIQFFAPTAQSVTRNVAILRPDGSNATRICQHASIVKGDSGAAFLCKLDQSGNWKVRIFGIENESIGAYVISVAPL